MMTSPSKTKRLRSGSDATESKTAISGLFSELLANIDREELTATINREELIRILKDLEEKSSELTATQEKLQSTEEELNRSNAERFLLGEDLKRATKAQTDIFYVQKTDSIIAARVAETVDQFKAGGSTNLASICMLRRVLGTHTLYVDSLVYEHNRTMRVRNAELRNAEQRQVQ
ncbi:hypothetical protein V498_05136 [Pseudogymnoascus sp. VKM F-4517 (FW-2822)]|nr:hypothetical protein V498_05136 [Pseudogymnoascus sp. VKM F-4517 (FW-2822)]